MLPKYDVLVGFLEEACNYFDCYNYKHQLLIARYHLAR